MKLSMQEVFVSSLLLSWQRLISADEQLHSFVDLQVLSQGKHHYPHFSDGKLKD